MGVAHFLLIMCLFLSLICLFILGARAQQSPMIDSISQDMVVDVGATVLLDCSVRFKGETVLQWVKKPVNPVDSELVISWDERVAVPYHYSVKRDRDSSTYQLQISGARETDGGQYECRIPLGVSNVVSRTVWVHVRLPPVILDNSTRSVKVSEGEKLVLECYATGLPQPTITWRRNNNALLPTGSAILRANRMEVDNVKMEDRGTYFCVANNGVDRGTTRSVHVSVTFRPVVRVTQPDVYQALFYNTELECHVESSPVAFVTWYKDLEEIKNNQYYQVSLVVISDQMSSSILSLQGTQARQFGNYTCRATNQLGSSAAYVMLHKVANPVCPPACDIRSRLTEYSDAGRVVPAVCVFVLMTVSALL